MDLAIRNGTVVTASGVFPADVGIMGERVAAIGEKLRGDKEIDATDCYVLPGAIDPHVHFQMPVGDYTSSDDFVTGTIAAACGGTTAIIDFVEPHGDEPFMEALAARRAEADGRVAVDYNMHMTIPAWHAAHAEALETLPTVFAAGIPSFKLYLAYGDLRLEDVHLYNALKAVGALGGLPIVHSENGPLCEKLRAEAVAADNTAPLYHARTRPPRQEAEATNRVMDIAALAGSEVYIVHVSCAEVAARIAAARARGERVYGETCPHYLALTADKLASEHGERFICAPPLRAAADHAALWGRLARYELDTLATDHCPFTASDKAGHDNFTTIPGGIPSIEIRLSLAHTLGVRAGHISLERWVEICSTAAARLFGFKNKGHLAPGFDADVVIFDPHKRMTVTANVLHENVDWTPYEGLELTGLPRHVLSRGRVVVQDGDFIGEEGWGRFVPRER